MSEQNEIQEILDVVTNIDVRLESSFKEIQLTFNLYQQAIVDLSERFKAYEEYIKEKCLPRFHSIEQEKLKMSHEINNLKEKITDQKKVTNDHDKRIDYIDTSATDISTRLFLLDKEVKEVKQIVQENSKINKSNEASIADINKEFEWLKKFKSQFQNTLFAVLIAIIFSSIALIYTNFQTNKEIRGSSQIKQEIVELIKKELKK